MLRLTPKGMKARDMASRVRLTRKMNIADLAVARKIKVPGADRPDPPAKARDCGGRGRPGSGADLAAGEVDRLSMF